MANSASAKKRIRRNDRRAVVNRNRISRMRTFTKRVELAIESGDYDAAMEAMKLAQPEIHRSVSKGAVKEKTASRKLSRLSARLKAIGGSSKKKTTTAKKAK